MTTSVNVVVLAGTLATEPYARTLPDGRTIIECRVQVPAPGRRELPLPVIIEEGADGYALALAGARAAADDLGTYVSEPHPGAFRKGSEVLIHGRLSRRFYRSGAGARSLTEVVASGVKVLTDPSAEVIPAGATITAEGTTEHGPADGFGTMPATMAEDASPSVTI